MSQFLVEPKLFADGPDGPYPVGSRCPKCSKVYFPRKRICPRCLGDNAMEEWPLSRKGTLMSFSVAHDSLMGLTTPYAFGYVRLPEGLVVYSLLSGCEPFEERLRIGMEMEMVMEPMMSDDMGNEIVTYKFRPANPPIPPLSKGGSRGD